jgi:arylsulfatase A
MPTHLTRRAFLGSVAAASAAAGFAGSVYAADPPGAPAIIATGKKPNVIVIMLDDLGAADAGCFGAADLQTSAIDALAGSGIRLTQLYAGGPICSPSRASLLTGRYPQRAGVEENIGSTPGSRGLPTDQITLAQMFKSAGYRTAHVGKWHLGYTPETMPLARGFDSSFGNMGGCIDNYSHYFYWDGPDRHDLWENGKEVWHEGEFFGDMLVDRCGKVITAADRAPFFLYLAINLPHYPLQGKTRWRDAYQHLKEPRARYAAQVSTADELIGQVMRQIHDSGLTDQTIVVLQSDHGHSTEDRAFGGGGSAGKYRGAKFSLFEGGIRVISTISWPGKIAAAVRDQLVAGCDWMPTLAELAGVPLPAARIDGKSMVPVLQSQTAQSLHNEFHWKFAEQWAVRRGDWKLLANGRDTSRTSAVPKSNSTMLFDLAADPGERTNLAVNNPDIVAELSRLHEAWLAEVILQK